LPVLFHGGLLFTATAGGDGPALIEYHPSGDAREPTAQIGAVDRLGATGEYQEYGLHRLGRVGRVVPSAHRLDQAGVPMAQDREGLSIMAPMPGSEQSGIVTWVGHGAHLYMSARQAR
jgi:hypothetical protein